MTGFCFDGVWWRGCRKPQIVERLGEKNRIESSDKRKRRMEVKAKAGSGSGKRQIEKC
jgi:hypothetical protein